MIYYRFITRYKTLRMIDECMLCFVRGCKSPVYIVIKLNVLLFKEGQTKGVLL